MVGEKGFEDYPHKHRSLLRRFRERHEIPQPEPVITAEDIALNSVDKFLEKNRNQAAEPFRGADGTFRELLDGMVGGGDQASEEVVKYRVDQP